MKRLSAKEIFELGERVSTKATIDGDFIPESGVGCLLSGTFAGTGREATLIDFCCGIGVNSLGYPGDLRMCSGNEWHQEAPVRLKDKLVTIAPVRKPAKAFLCNSGAEAVESAEKMCLARRYREGSSERRVFGAFGGAFHGRTLGALSLNCSKSKHTEAFFPDRGDMSEDGRIKERAIPVCHIPFPEVDNSESIARFVEVVNNRVDWSTMNAFFLELVQGEGGIRVIDQLSLDYLVEECRRNGVYLVVDEVQTGMMRTGKMFACMHFGLEPDIICLSKALGGGQVGIGATVCMAEFDFELPGQHSNTFGGSPLPSRLSLETIDSLESLDPEKVQERIDKLASFAPEGLGLMRRIVFSSVEKRDKVCDLARERGVLVIAAGEKAIRLMPPINVSLYHLSLGIRILESCIRDVGL